MNNTIGFGINWKILSAVFVTLLAVVCGTLFLVQWSFDRGFLEYVNRIEREAQQKLIETLAGEYERHGNWEFIADNNRLLRRLYLGSFRRSEAAGNHLGLETSVPGRPPGLRGRITGGLLPSRIALLDEDKRVLAGARHVMKQRQGIRGKIDLLTVRVDGGIVGYVAVAPRVLFSSVYDLRFSRHLERSFLFIAALVLVVSLTIALPLSRRLARPALKHSGGSSSLPADEIEIDDEQYRIKIKGKPLETTLVEFKLFKILAATPGQVWSRRRLMDKIYPDHRIVSERTIDSHVKKLRKKIAGALPQRDIIHSVYGAGYKLEIK